MSAFGFLVSAFSAFAAIGGAFMTVPFMLWCNVPMLRRSARRRYRLSDRALRHDKDLSPPACSRRACRPSVGFVFLPALGGIVLGMLVAPLGAAAGAPPADGVAQGIFALLFYVMATRMLITFL
jgi:uncharacterized membrane protein YfcA